MKFIYFSQTGNIKRFIQKVDVKVEDGNGMKVVDDSFVLITYTTGFGEVPQEVIEFLKVNRANLSGVIGSGNRNWGINYCKASQLISKRFKVPVLMEFELAGNSHDVEKFNEIVKGLK